MKSLILQFCLVMMISTPTWSASVSKIKGSKALISLDGLAAQKGDEYYTVDAAGKKKGVVKITAVRSNQAMGDVTKGQPEIGHTLTLFKKAPPRPAKASQTASAIESSSEDEGSQRHAGWSNFGVLGSYLINKMSAKFTLNGVEKSTDMAGNGFGVLGYYDYKVGEKLQLRGSAGIEQFQVSESRTAPDCDKGTSTTCNAIINYISGYGLAKYNFVNGYTKAWFGGGGGFLFALSKSSTVLDSSQISSNYVMTLAGGFDVNMKQGAYLPVVFEYSFFPSSTTVSANYIAFRIGWGWR